MNPGWRHPARNWRRDIDHWLSQWAGADWKLAAQNRTGWAASEKQWVDWARTASGALRDPVIRRDECAAADAAAEGRRVRARLH